MELSSSVLLDGTSNAWKEKCLKLFNLNVGGRTHRVLHPAVGLKHLVNGVPCDPGLVPVLLLVVVVVDAPEGAVVVILYRWH